jgi:phytoene desaturase
MRTVTGPTDSVVVVGAGLGGLSAALHLAGAGRRVTVVEQAEGPGGLAGQLTLGGYRFDTGPTVLTLPELIDDALAAVGERTADWLDLVRVEPAYRARFADGSAIDVHTDSERMAAEIGRTCSAADAAGYLRFVDHLHRLYTTEFGPFMASNLDDPRDLLTPAALGVLRLGGLRSLSRTVGRYFGDERLRRIFSFQALYAGVAPQRARSVYAVISYLDCVRGVYFPRGGIAAVPAALAGAAAAHGVEFRYGTRVERIETTGGRARSAITAAGERIAADVVVVNADVTTAQAGLLDRPPPRRRPRYSPSCVVLHVGSRTAPPTPRHHTVEFGSAWASTFTEIIDQGRPMSDPSFLVGSPTVTDPDLAPPGGHTYYVLFPAPNTDRAPGLDLTDYRDHMIATLERRGYPGFGAAIEVADLVTPADWAAAGLAAGTPFSAAHTLRQTGPLRPPTRDRRLDNVLYCGASVQPGVGVPMVLLSGRLAAARITGRSG